MNIKLFMEEVLTFPSLSKFPSKKSIMPKRVNKIPVVIRAIPISVITNQYIIAKTLH
jgi:hypothetical protein